jgi:hypothetical protein
MGRRLLVAVGVLLIAGEAFAAQCRPVGASSGFAQDAKLLSEIAGRRGDGASLVVACCAGGSKPEAGAECGAGDRWVLQGNCSLADKAVAGLVGAGRAWSCVKAAGPGVASNARAEGVTCEEVSRESLGDDASMLAPQGSKDRMPASQIFGTKEFKIGAPGCEDAVVCETTFLCTHPVDGGTARSNRHLRSGIELNRGFRTGAIQRRAVAESDSSLDNVSPGSDSVRVYEKVACAQVAGKCPDPTACYASRFPQDYGGDARDVRGTSATGNARVGK